MPIPMSAAATIPIPASPDESCRQPGPGRDCSVLGSSAEELYLDLLKKCLTRYLFPQQLRPFAPAEGRLAPVFWGAIQTILKGGG
jgi:hypothetical protein